MVSTTRPRRLLLVGSVVVDVTLPVPRLPDRGGDVLASRLEVAAGGGMFVLRAAVRGGLPAVYAGRHGAGSFGQVVRAALAAAGVETAFGEDDGGDTGPCIVLVEPDGERTMVTANGVEATLDRAHLDRLDVRPDDAVYVSGYDLGYPVTGPAVAGWLDHLPVDCLVVVDPGPLAAGIPADVLGTVLARTDVLTHTAREGDVLGAARPAALGRDAVVVVRDGPRDVQVLVAGEPPQRVPVTRVAAADTTGAGDTHTGALLAARGAGLTWPDAVAAANQAAAAHVRSRSSPV